MKMEEDILKLLAKKELKQSILNKAKEILAKRETNSNEKNNEHETKQLSDYLHKEELVCALEQKTNITESVQEENQKFAFFNLQQFSIQYKKTCQLGDLYFDNQIEYDLLLSFLTLFNKEFPILLNQSSIDPLGRNKEETNIVKEINEEEIKEDKMIKNMVDLFMKKLIFYCKDPLVLLLKNETNKKNDHLIDAKLTPVIQNFFNQLENKKLTRVIHNCIYQLLSEIYQCKPNASDLSSWISRQTFIDVIKIVIDENANRCETCILCVLDIIKRNYEHASYLALDNLMVLSEVLQYAIISLVELKKKQRFFSYSEEEWYNELQILVQELKLSKWKMLLEQLLLIITYLYKMKRQNFKKDFNEWYQQRAAMGSVRNISYTRWFKIEMPITMNLFK